MNRFRQLKQRLIKSKRESQKLAITLTTQTQLEQWVQNQLEYYGISPSSYRLKQLKNLFQLHQKQTNLLSTNLLQQNQTPVQKQINTANNNNFHHPLYPQSVDKLQTSQIKPFVKKNSTFYQMQNKVKPVQFKDHIRSYKVEERKCQNKIYKNECLIQEQYKVCQDNEQSQQRTERNMSQIERNMNKLSQGNKLICKKTRRQHMNSMNDIDSIKRSQTNFNNKSNYINNLFASYQDHNSTPKTKQLDYYTLILQLTAQLNYSRLNKETNNQKSILKQIKNLISYIQGNSNTSTTHSSLPHTDPYSKNNDLTYKSNDPYSKNSDPNSNNKSCHTFSSIHSNDSLNSIPNQHQFLHSSPSSYNPINKKRCILTSEKHFKQNHNIISNQQNLDEGNSDRQYQQSQYSYNQQNLYSQKYQNQQSLYQQEHDQTFKSINQFEEENSPHSEQNSIIDIVNDTHSPNHEVILIQQTEDQPNIIIQNSPLSKITQHQSEYTNSIQPSVNESPSKLTHHRIQKSKSIIASQSLPDSNQNHIDIPFSQTLKNQLYSKDSNNWLNFLPQNQIILKKLSDKLQNTQNCQNVFQQSLEYKRILYMLDSEYGNSDLKNRTFSSMLGQTSSLPLNQSGSQKSISLYYLKNPSDFSAKSFNKQIFESNEENQNKNLHKKHDHCLMNNLNDLFKNQSTKNSKSPRLLKFESQNDNESFKHSQKPKKHQRSKTSFQSSNQGLNKTRKYRLNLLSQLSYQVNQQSQQNAFDIDKYEKIKTQYEDDSVYHKVSRNSYLTSSSSNSNAVTSSQSQLDGGINFIKKGNLIVKKNKDKKNKEIQIIDQDRKNLIVKKNKKSKNLQSLDSENTKRFLKQNKQNLSFSDYYENLFPKINNQKSQSQSLRNEKRSINDFYVTNDLELGNSLLKGLSQSNDSNQKQDSGIFNKQKNLEEWKDSEMSCRPIKYKVYTREPQVGQKEDKRKVLKDIVSILNTKYNKNIQLKE